MTTVYVGIVTYNSLQDLPQCLASLASQTFTNLDISLVDNASSDGTLQWLKTYHNLPIRLFQNQTNVGFAKAHNQIISQCSFDAEDFYLALNPDIELTDNYISELVDGVRLSNAGWVTGKLYWSNQDDSDRAMIYSTGHAIMRGGYVFNIGNGLQDTRHWEEKREIWGAPATALIIAAELIRSLQAIDCVYEESFFLYNEDTDFDWKARNLGWICYYIPTAIAYHRGGTPTAKLKVLSIGNRYLSAIKNAPFRDLLTYILPMMCLHILLRCMVTPLNGLLLILHVAKYAPKMFYKRRLIRSSRSIYIDWANHAKSEITSQPRTARERLQIFIHQLRN